MAEPEPEPAAPTEPSAPDEPEAAPGPTDEEITITIWLGRDEYVPVDQFAGFTDLYPNITIEYDVVPTEQATTEYLRTFQAGQEPDIILIDADQRGPIVVAGGFRDMSDMIERWEQEDPELYNSLFQFAWDEASFAGEGPYGVALNASSQWHVVRTDLYEEFGIPFPDETFDDVLEASRIIKEGTGGEVYGYGAAFGRREPRAEFLAHFFAVGGQFDEDDLPILDAEGPIYQCEFYQTLFREELIPADAFAWSGGGDVRGPFLDGLYAIGEQSELAYPGYQEVYEYGTEFRSQRMPHRPGAEDEFRQPQAGFGYFVSANAEWPYEASLLLRWLATPEILGHVHRTYISSTSGAVWDEVAANEADERPWLPDLAPHIPAITNIPATAVQLQMYTVLQDVMQACGSETERPAAEIMAQYQEVLDTTVRPNL